MHYIFSADITPEMLKLYRVTKVKIYFLVLVYVFNFDLFEFLVAILEKGLLVLSRFCMELALLGLYCHDLGPVFPSTALVFH